MLDVSEAQPFIGTWVVTMETPRGSAEQTIILSDVGGKVAARMEGGRGGGVDITEVSKDGDDLLLEFERSFQGQSIDIELTLSLDGDMLHATQDIGGGQFSMSGTGKRQ